MKKFLLVLLALAVAFALFAAGAISQRVQCQMDEFDRAARTEELLLRIYLEGLRLGAQADDEATISYFDFLASAGLNIYFHDSLEFVYDEQWRKNALRRLERTFERCGKPCDRPLKTRDVYQEITAGRPSLDRNNPQGSPENS